MKTLAIRLCGTVAVVAVLVGGARLRPVLAGHDPMGGHMKMTTLKPMQPGDQARADAVLAAARTFADQYVDYKKALADGYTIFMPELEQPVYHFTLNSSAAAANRSFDPSRPTSLLYEKTPDKKGYKLIGVMYTDRIQATEDELNARIPLSIAQWHVHTNLCIPMDGEKVDWMAGNQKFGLEGSITTADACKAAGGMFLPHIFGWMVHVYPFETDPKKIWSAGMDDEHGMQHDKMPMGMPME